MPVTVRDQLGGRIPPGWTPAPCVELDNEPWDGFTVPWRTDISDWPVDQARTANLARSDVQVPVDVSAPGQVWDGSVGGIPVQDCRNVATTTVWDLGRPVTWEWFSPRWPTVQVPLPALVRREGDPMAAWDRHWCGIDVDRRRLHEAIQLDSSPWNRVRTIGQTDWTAGWPGGGPGLATWDLSRPWNSPGQPRGVVAAAVPLVPHLIRADELAAGTISHALFLVLADYAGEHTGYARGSDGTARNHPCRAGERLRLPRTAVEWFTPGTPERVVAEGLWRHGCIVGDRSDHSGSATSKPGRLSCTQDPRINTGWEGLGLRLSDLEVVHQP